MFRARSERHDVRMLLRPVQPPQRDRPPQHDSWRAWQVKACACLSVHICIDWLFIHKPYFSNTHFVTGDGGYINAFVSGFGGLMLGATQSGLRLVHCILLFSFIFPFFLCFLLCFIACMNDSCSEVLSIGKPAGSGSGWLSNCLSVCLALALWTIHHRHHLGFSSCFLLLFLLFSIPLGRHHTTDQADGAGAYGRVVYLCFCTKTVV